jgi:hypothetical protein
VNGAVGLYGLTIAPNPKIGNWNIGVLIMKKGHPTEPVSLYTWTCTRCALVVSVLDSSN